MYRARLIAFAILCGSIAACSDTPADPVRALRAAQPARNCVGDSTAVYDSGGNLTGYTDMTGIRC